MLELKLNKAKMGWHSTSVSRKAIRDTSSALRRSPHPSTNVVHCCLTSVSRQILITLPHNSWKSGDKKNKTTPRVWSLETRASLGLLLKKNFILSFKEQIGFRFIFFVLRHVQQPGSYCEGKFTGGGNQCILVDVKILHCKPPGITTPPPRLPGVYG